MIPFYVNLSAGFLVTESHFHHLYLVLFAFNSYTLNTLILKRLEPNPVENFQKIEKKLKVIKKHLKDILKLVICITGKIESKSLKRLLKVLKLNQKWDGVMMLTVKNIIIS